MAIRNLIDFGDVSREDWDALYAEACRIMDAPEAYAEACKGKISCNLFYEPSTRTNFSFQTAMLRLGGSVFGFANPSSSSVAKGESLKDTVKMVSGYANVIVIRHPREGAALAASLYSDVPVINAGDGSHMHPTQTTADLTTILRLHGTVDGLAVGICGDLRNGRTVHSLIKALAKFQNVRFFLISPRELALPDYMRHFMQKHNLPFVEVTGLEAVIPQLDVLYMTRIQQERFDNPLDYERNKGVYVLTNSILQRGREKLLVMHPLPRVDEIADDVDNDPRAVYFQQGRFGMFARMALLKDLAHQPRIPQRFPLSDEGPICRNPNCITQTELYLPPLTKETEAGLCCAYCDKPIHPSAP